MIPLTMEGNSTMNYTERLDEASALLREAVSLLDALVTVHEAKLIGDTNLIGVISGDIRIRILQAAKEINESLD